MDTKVINSLRSLALDMINEAGSGHPGIALDAAPIMYTLFANHLVFNNNDGSWINRDRFVLSAGHASALLYSTLFYSDYPISIEDLKRFRKINSKLKGHPSLNKSIGIEMTTGPLGEGFASSVGMAIAEEYSRNLVGKDIINNYTYVLASDGDLMEGISYEAASLAGSLHLGHLIVLYDSNSVTHDGKTKDVFEENVLKRFEAMGWHTQLVTNGEDYVSIDKAIIKAKQILDKPSIIEIRTIIGIGTSIENTSKAHSGVLTDEDMGLVKDRMNITKVPFHISKEAIEYIRSKQNERNDKKYNEWLNNYNNIIEKDNRKKKYLSEIENGELNIGIKDIKINFDDNMIEDIRITNSNLMNVISTFSETFVGGSADMVQSTKTYLKDMGDFSVNNKSGRNIRFGVRENAMGAILNGMALSGLKPFGSTFLAFSDYLKPSMRLTAMMNLPVTYIFTHDSIKTGEDGETHQPIEQIPSIRLIPNMKLFRPADVNELVASWDYIINTKCPSALIVPKEEKGKLKGSSVKGAMRGGYIIKTEKGRLSGIIIATGSEVETAISISDILEEKGLYTRVISMPSVEVFNNETSEYKSSLIEIGSKIIVLEASNDPIWNEFVYNKKYILNVNGFGKSGSKEEVLRYFNYDIDSLTERIEKLLK